MRDVEPERPGVERDAPRNRRLIARSGTTADPGVCADAGETDLARLGTLGDQIGLLFQIRDDILDVEATSEQLGKTAGKDQAAEKLTYPRVFGLEGSRERLLEVSRDAHRTAEQLPGGGEPFRSLVEFLVRRDS